MTDKTRLPRVRLKRVSSETREVIGILKMCNAATHSSVSNGSYLSQPEIVILRRCA